MATLKRDDLVRRLRAVRMEMGLQPSQLAARLAVGRTTYLGWEAEAPRKPNFPAEEAMMTLCDIVPGLTLDYLYRGKLGTLPLPLTLRLVSRELGLDPNQPGQRAAEVLAVLGSAV
jgi:DNA-binding XRE family transcriptional regulator